MTPRQGISMKLDGFGGLEVLIPKVGHKGGICLPMSAVAEGAIIPKGWIFDPMRQAYFAPEDFSASITA